jgi:hypothetical protein
VTGKGIANSRELVHLLVGDFVGDRVGEGGVARKGMEEGPLGEADASMRVREDVFCALSCGRSANGTFGIDTVSG